MFFQIDFASRDCQTQFFEKMEFSGQLRPGERPDERGGGGSGGGGGGGGGGSRYTKDDYYGNRNYEYDDNRDEG